MKNRYALFFTLLAGTLLVLFANVFVQKRMATIVKEDKLVDENFAAEGTPPIVAFSTMALGGFRGLIADILWIRAGDLQQKGKYYELVQLSDWILKLQPKFSAAASHMGWNMAYNVSVACKRPEDRWRWVRRGIQLMQDAMTMNPNDPLVYQELGWIYQHKLGNVLDDAQRYYKETMARDLIFLYGKHYPDWEAWAATPATEEAFREMFPADHPAWLAIMEYNQGDLERLFGEFRLNGGLPKELKSKLTPEDADVLDYYFRRKWLKKDWNVEPEKILAVNEAYGELDWLLPESYAIYWAHVGKDLTEGRDQLPLTRMILQSLVATFNYGRMLLPKENEVSDFFMLVPNTGVIDAARKIYKEVMQSDEYAHSPFEALYENFLIDSIVTAVVAILVAAVDIIPFMAGPEGVLIGVVAAVVVLFLGKEKMQDKMLSAELPKAVRMLIPKNTFRSRLDSIADDVKASFYESLQKEKDDQITQRMVEEISGQIEQTLIKMAEVVEIPLG